MALAMKAWDCSFRNFPEMYCKALRESVYVLTMKREAKDASYSIRLTQALLDNIRTEAKSEGRSVANFICHVLQDYCYGQQSYREARGVTVKKRK